MMDGFQGQDGLLPLATALRFMPPLAIGRVAADLSDNVRHDQADSCRDFGIFRMGARRR